MTNLWKLAKYWPLQISGFRSVTLTKQKIWKLDFDKFAPTECSIDDFGVGDTIGEISVRECKLDFGLAQRYENP